MALTREQRDKVASELKGFATDLNLSEDQKQKVHRTLSEATENCRNTSARIPTHQKKI